MTTGWGGWVGEWVGAWVGRMNMNVKSCVTISDLITPAHKAHFRAELWYAMPHVAYRHLISTIHAKEWQKKWSEFLPLVFKGRQENEEDAHMIPCGQLISRFATNASMTKLTTTPPMRMNWRMLRILSTELDPYTLYVVCSCLNQKRVPTVGRPRSTSF